MHFPPTQRPHPQRLTPPVWLPQDAVPAHQERLAAWPNLPWAPLATKGALPALWRPWLCERGSLTLALSRYQGTQVQVQVLQEAYTQASAHEAHLLGIKQNMPVWARHVLLRLQGHAWVFARTLVPKHAQAVIQRLQPLGNQALGSWLFQQKQIRRQALWVTQAPHLRQQLGMHWGRGSCFLWQQQSIWVSEFFLTPMYQALIQQEALRNHP